MPFRPTLTNQNHYGNQPSAHGHWQNKRFTPYNRQPQSNWQQPQSSQAFEQPQVAGRWPPNSNNHVTDHYSEWTEPEHQVYQNEQYSQNEYYDEFDSGYYDQNYHWPDPHTAQPFYRHPSQSPHHPPQPPTASHQYPMNRLPFVDLVNKELDEQLAKQRQLEKQSTKNLLKKAAELLNIRPEDGFAQAKAIYMMRSGQYSSLNASADVESEIDDF